MSEYSKKIASRNIFRFLKGLYPRGKKYVTQGVINWIARNKGATIGKNVVIPYGLAKIANSNLQIGNHVSIQTSLLDTRSKITIGNNVIIGDGVQILTASHNVDSSEWEHKYYGIIIEDYVWLATRTFVLPSCKNIGYGAVCAAGSVIAKNVDKMSIVAGNPAIHLRERKAVHSHLVVESLLGGDFEAYVSSYLSRN